MGRIDQPYPSDWPDLPESVYYDREQSEKISVTQEPEYIITTDEFNFSFIIRNYENGEWEISMSPPSNIKSRRFKSEEECIYMFNNLLNLLDSKYIHTPYKIEGVKLRGYVTEEEIIYEYTREGNIDKIDPIKRTVSSFQNANWTKGDNLGTLLVQTRSYSLKIPDEFVFNYYFENGVIRTSTNSTEINISPIPHKNLLIKTIEKSISDETTDIQYVNQNITPKVIKRVI